MSSSPGVGFSAVVPSTARTLVTPQLDPRLLESRPRRALSGRQYSQQKPASVIVPSAIKAESFLGIQQQNAVARPKSILQQLVDEMDDPFLLCGTYKQFVSEMEKQQKQKIKFAARADQIDMRYFKHLYQINRVYTETKDLELRAENALRASKVKQQLQQTKYVRQSSNGQFIQQMTVKQEPKQGAVDIKRYFNIFKHGEIKDQNVSSMRAIFNRQFD